MKKIKAKKSEEHTGNQGPLSVIQGTASKQPITGVRILFQGNCPKLTTRGRGDLSYELGIDEGTEESYVRISANVSSGAFSNEWIALGQIRGLLDLKTQQQKAFSAVAMEGLFSRRSANNYGYLAAVLIAEGAMVVLPGKPVMLSLDTWEHLLQKILLLKEEGIRLTDHIAFTAKDRAEKKAPLMSNLNLLKPTESTKPTSKTKDINLLDEPLEGTPE